MSKPRVLVLAESCNPEWPSLPVVGYKYARALAQITDLTLVTHIRNRENIEKSGDLNRRVVYIDNEWIAARMYKAAKFLRGGTAVAWSTNQMMAYLPYLAFEYQALKHFRRDFEEGAFDLVHRITPMSPTLPSYISGRTKQPFIIGPLNGNLDWPAAFSAEQKREKEGLRRLRGLYRFLPFTRSTYRNADGILAAFEHTIADLKDAPKDRIISVPEVGFDRTLFNDQGRAAPFSKEGAFQFLFVGRLVPYKVAEAAVRAFVSSDALRSHILRIVGDGPEEERLKQIVTETDAENIVIFEGRKTQAEVADLMRSCDAFVFPSVRELGAGVVIEAMASGMVCIVTNYGAPGNLVGETRGVRIPLQPLTGLVESTRDAMEACLNDPASHRAMAQAAEQYARKYFDWDAKAAFTLGVYRAMLEKAPVSQFTQYK